MLSAVFFRNAFAPRAGAAPKAVPLCSARAPVTHPHKAGGMKRRLDTPTSAALPSEKLPAKTLLYCALPKRTAEEVAAAPGDQSASSLLSLLQELTLTVPRGPAPTGSRWCEFALVRAISLARGVEGAAPDEAALRALGHDGWLSADGLRVQLLDAEPLLRLIDDDKQSGKAQALLTDMFTRLQVRGQQGGAGPPSPSSPRTATQTAATRRHAAAAARGPGPHCWTPLAFGP